MGFRDAVDRGFGDAIEAVVLVLVVLSPWAFGAVEPAFEFFLYAGVALLLVLWAGRIICQGQFVWKKCPVALCLAAFFLLGVWQLQPLPRPVLSFLSPGAVRLYDELLPAVPEKLPFGEVYQRPATAAGNRLSLYPGATRRELIRLLAVFLLFAVVRNNACSPDHLRRLFVALVLNGCALAFFALFQFFTSPHDKVYWQFQTKGAVFGPFVSRTHYPFYLNVCIGAVVGLLLVRVLPTVPERTGRDDSSPSLDLGAGLHDPLILWLGCALALMFGSVALSMSRGGYFALAGGVAVLVLMRRPRRSRLAWVGGALIMLAAAVALVGWLGGKLVEARLATIWKGEAVRQSRLPLWTDSWPLVLEFPLLGTGYGTFPYAEPLHREHTASYFVHEHAHNEFLEALIEGGVVRLALSLLTVGLVFRYGIRAALRRGPDGALGLGALFGFTALVVHSIGDFGLHLPAIAVLATVLCAQLAALGQTRNSDAPGASPADAYVLRTWGLAPIIGALTLLMLALLLCTEGRRMALVQAYRQAAANSADLDRQVALLTQAARLMPDSGRVLNELAEARLERFRQEQARWNALLPGQMVLAGARSFSLLPFAGVGESPGVGMAVPAWEEATVAERLQQEKQYLVPALRAFLQARDVCPLMARPHLQLALNHPHLRDAPPRSVYLDRAKRVITNDADHWFLFGMVEYVEQQYPQAARSWHRSLELSDRYLPLIAQLSKNGIGPERLAQEVLPGRPDMLVDVAVRLYPKPNEAAQRKPFLERALAELRNSSKPADVFLRGRAHALLGQPEEAEKAYRQALTWEPRQAGWHLELAKLLRDQGRFGEAREELIRVLVLRPGDSQASELLAAMEHELKKS